MESQNTDKNRRPSGILRNASQEAQPTQKHHMHHHSSNEHVKFDEEVIQEHDKERGTRTKIDEPKTPYPDPSEESGQEESFQETAQDVEMKDVQNTEEKIKQHLNEAERNKLLNAQLYKEKQNLFDVELVQRLDEQAEDQKQEEMKHKEFENKRKQHYKNEVSPAMLLKNKGTLEEEDEDSQS